MMQGVFIMTNIKDLLSRVDRLRALLLDPHPGLAEWRLGFDAASESLLHFYDRCHIDPFGDGIEYTGPRGKLLRLNKLPARETICPDCGSPDPAVCYIPQDTHTLCENMWHRTTAG